VHSVLSTGFCAPHRVDRSFTTAVAIAANVSNRTPVEPRSPELRIWPNAPESRTSRRAEPRISEKPSGTETAAEPGSPRNQERSGTENPAEPRTRQNREPGEPRTRQNREPGEPRTRRTENPVEPRTRWNQEPGEPRTRWNQEPGGTENPVEPRTRWNRESGEPRTRWNQEPGGTENPVEPRTEPCRTQQNLAEPRRTQVFHRLVTIKRRRYNLTATVRQNRARFVACGAGRVPAFLVRSAVLGALEDTE
jgi:hypothetical protein